jgi:hypothetical protein
MKIRRRINENGVATNAKKIMAKLGEAAAVSHHI